MSATSSDVEPQTDEVTNVAIAEDVTSHTDSSAADKRNALRNAIRQRFVGKLTEHEERWMSDEEMGIYVRARETLSERVDILASAMEWRIANRDVLQSCECPYCNANPRSHDARLFGFDKEGDFVFMNCFELPQDIAVESVSRHMTCLMERALKEFPAPLDSPLEDDGHPRVRTWTFIFDLYGFGMRYYDPRVSLRLLELFQVAYRARVKKLIVLDAPLLFWGLWQMVSPMMKTATVEKVEFSDWETFRPSLEARCGPVLTDELLVEAQENRDPVTASCKSWTTFYGKSLAASRQ